MPSDDLTIVKSHNPSDPVIGPLSLRVDIPFDDRCQVIHVIPTLDMETWEPVRVLVDMDFVPIALYRTLTGQVIALPTEHGRHTVTFPAPPERDDLWAAIYDFGDAMRELGMRIPGADVRGIQRAREQVAATKATVHRLLGFPEVG